jgi:hypothetical protein
LSASPSGDLTARDSFFALANRKEPAIASLADSTVGSDDSKAPVLIVFPTQRRLDGTPMGGQLPAPACSIDELLLTGNQLAVKGVLEGGDVSKQELAVDLFNGLNRAGSM